VADILRMTDGVNGGTGPEPGPASAPAPAERSLSATLLRVTLGIAAVAAVVLLGREVGGYVPRFATWVDGLGALGPIVFIVGYVLAVVGFVPGSILTLAAGAIFGLAEGVLYVLIAAWIGSCAAFLIARYVARSAVEARVGANPSFTAIDRAVAAEGRKIVFLLRLSPAFPFSLLNYGLGLTRVSFKDYAIAGVGMLPGTLLYTYYGKVIGSVAEIASGTAPEAGVERYVLLGVGLVATIAVTAIVTRIARRALASNLEEDAA